MTWQQFVVIIAVVSLGLIAGQMLAILLANLANRRQEAAEWTRRFQFENRLFTRTMPPALLVPMITMIASACVASPKGRVWLFASAASLAVVFAITMAGNVPINRQVAVWQADDAPRGWAEVRDRWITLHALRTVVGVVALICSIVGLLDFS